MTEKHTPVGARGGEEALDARGEEAVDGVEGEEAAERVHGGPGVEEHAGWEGDGREGVDGTEEAVGYEAAE